MIIYHLKQDPNTKNIILIYLFDVIVNSINQRGSFIFIYIFLWQEWNFYWNTDTNVYILVHRCKNIYYNQHIALGCHNDLLGWSTTIYQVLSLQAEFVDKLHRGLCDHYKQLWKSSSLSHLMYERLKALEFNGISTYWTFLKGGWVSKRFWQNFLKLSYDFYYDFILVSMQKKSIPSWVHFSFC